MCETIHASGPLPAFGGRVLGLFLCVRLPLTYLRHNPCQELLAEAYCVWQATASRVIAAHTPLIAQTLQEHVPTVEDLDPTAQLIIDGTLLECWSWKDHPELDLRQAQDHGAERPGRLHPLRPTGLGVRPPRRQSPRHPSPAPPRPARRPHRRPTQRDTTTPY
nr:transposase family protein [Actinomyces oris]